MLQLLPPFMLPCAGLQLQRLMQRDGSTAADAQARIDAQLPLSVKEAAADVILRNNGDLKQLQEQVREQRRGSNHNPRC